MITSKLQSGFAKPYRVTFVLPVLAPYWVPRLEELARNPALDIQLLVERNSFAHRPGWGTTDVEGVTVASVESMVLPSKRRHGDLGYDIATVRAIPWRLTGRLLEQRPDVVVVCNATQMIFAWIARIFGRFHIALNVEDTLHATRNHSRLSRMVKRLTYRSADLYFAFGEEAREFLLSIGVAKRIFITSWSLDASKFRRDPIAREEVREKFASRDKVMFLYVGQFIPRKGILPLLQAWSRLSPASRSRACLVMIGDGPMRAESEAFARSAGLDEVRFVGGVSYEEVRRYYSAADVFVLPTLEDLNSLVVPEAMAMGCAVMTTPYNGAHRYVESGKTGWVFDVLDAEGAAACLEQAIADPERIARMGAEAADAAKAFDNKLVMRRYMEDLEAWKSEKNPA